MIYQSWIDSNTRQNYPVPKKVSNKEIKIGWTSVKGAIGNDKKITKHTTEKYTCSYKIRVYFTPDQENIVKQWLEISRWITNQTIKNIRTEKLKTESQRQRLTHYSERKRFNQFKLDNPEHPMVKLINKSNYPSHIGSESIKRVFSAKKSADKNQNNKRQSQFTHEYKMRYIKSTKPIQIMMIESECFSRKINTFSVGALGYIKSDELFCLKDSDDKFIGRTSVLQYNKNTGHWYMYCPRDKFKKCPPTHQNTRKCALDPGSRKFLTLYDGNRVSIIGDNTKERLDKLLRQTERKLNEFNSKAQWLKYIRKRHNKIDNLVRDLHWKSAKYLATNYDTVIVGILSTTSCIRRKDRRGNDRKIGANSARLLQTLSHYTFRQRLEYMCNKYGCEYKEQDEYNTSQICGGCGAKHSMASLETYTCPDCKWSWDRDFNGARNIMIKNDKVVTR